MQSKQSEKDNVVLTYQHQYGEIKGYKVII